MHLLHCITQRHRGEGALTAELASDAERELSAFSEAVMRQYGAAEKARAVEDWLTEFERAAWPIASARTAWRQVTIQAASRMARRLLQRPVQA